MWQLRLNKRLETKGIEPSFRRCDRHVLPLHHVPGITNLSCLLMLTGHCIEKPLLINYFPQADLKAGYETIYYRIRWCSNFVIAGARCGTGRCNEAYPADTA